MSAKLKVEGHEHLVRDINSGAIVNTNVTEYQLYMKRVRSREQQGDQIRSWLLYTSPSPRDLGKSRMPSSA